LRAGGTEWRLVLTESCRGFETQSDDAMHVHCVMTCHSDTILGTAALGYGQSRSFNSMTCESQEAGIACTDNRSGHYFQLARGNYELH
jgi:hypothetical protein